MPLQVWGFPARLTGLPCIGPLRFCYDSCRCALHLKVKTGASNASHTVARNFGRLSLDPLACGCQRRERRLRRGRISLPDQVQIHTDGACLGNPGPGGYGVVLRMGDRERELSGGFCLTTNNRMELLAVIKGLEALTRPCRGGPLQRLPLRG